MKKTVKRAHVKGNTYRLANLGYARGFAIQVLRGRNYQIVLPLGWLDAAAARAYFNHFIEGLRQRMES